MPKSYVGVGVSVCPVCLIEHSECVLLDKRMKDTLEPKQATGWAMCKTCADLKDQGYIALVCVSNEPKGLSDAVRTGVNCHVRASVWSQLFSVPVPPKGLAFVQPAVIEALQRAQGEDGCLP